MVTSGLDSFHRWQFSRIGATILIEPMGCPNFKGLRKEVHYAFGPSGPDFATDSKLNLSAGIVVPYKRLGNRQLNEALWT